MGWIEAVELTIVSFLMGFEVLIRIEGFITVLVVAAIGFRARRSMNLADMSA